MSKENLKVGDILTAKESIITSKDVGRLTENKEYIIIENYKDRVAVINDNDEVHFFTFGNLSIFFDIKTNPYD
jgi:hypothetical protein